ncbi:hypothetical protein [Afipia clevelandensis]|uniref:Uncharacterized protein n=1 Tax=Afipia clevelandensis ATCC 49720 TaxID=883079 RepID=K8PDX1_9BRAD|nr:hypothetical protein [Afipia clevelandensis]EKS37755.1 hypothetical protein HMPREF9696_01705 [Afipia clevelandensis ATCC 49720]
MAGSISLAGVQQFDVLGRLLGGAKVYWIQAGTTSTPQNAYYDAGLVTPLANPLTLGADARIPFHYLADGQIKVRIVDSDGVTRFEQDNILVIGPSSGEGGGGGVDPTTVFQTGDVLWMPIQGTRTGWVRANGRTMGSASSGATERANADTATLYAYLWNNFSNTICPVSTGRGANASADFAANKTITLLDWRGYVPGGLDDMGNSAASRWANVPVVSGDTVTAGAVLGEATHQIIKAELPADAPTGTVAMGGSIPITISGGTPVFGGTASVSVGSGSGTGLQNNLQITATASIASLTATFTGGALGSGTAHNNVQKTVLGTFFLKL